MTLNPTSYYWVRRKDEGIWRMATVERMWNSKLRLSYVDFKHLRIIMSKIEQYETIEVLLPEDLR